MPVTLYQSTDAGAPILTGEAGKVAELLKVCLVTGYGAKAGAGWTCPFENANQKAFRNSVALGTGFYFAVDDNAPGAGVGKEARIRGYEAMTDEVTGTNTFGLYYIRKSSLADATARAWFVIADEKTCYVRITTGDTNGWHLFGFGDFTSWLLGDVYHAFLSGRNVENNTSFTVSATQNDRFASTANFLLTNAGGNVIARDITATASVGGTFTWSPAAANTNIANSAGSVGGAYPHPVNGGLIMGKIYCAHSGYIRGEMRGLWNVSHVRPLADGTIVTGVSGLVGKEFIAFRNSNSSQVLIEISDTWSS